MILRYFILHYKALNLLKFNSNYSSMSSINNRLRIKFLSNGYLNYSKSLLIMSYNENYLINCGEGTQKIMIENGFKLSNLRNILFTSKNFNNFGGLIGVSLGLISQEISRITFHGIPGAVELINLSKNLLEETLCKITFSEEPILKDEVLQIDKFSYDTADENNCHLCTGYLFSTAKMRPKLDMNKLMKMSLPKQFMKSPRMKEFFTQSSVDIDGQILESIDFLIPSPIPDRLLIFECPTLHHIPQLMDKLPYSDFNNSDGLLRIIVHLTDRHIFQSNQYQALIKKINSHFHDTQLPVHTIIDSNCDNHPSYVPFYLQTVLNQYFDEDIFPKLQLFEDYKEKYCDILPVKDIDMRSVSDDNDNRNYDVVYAEPCMEFFLNNTSECSQRFITEEWLKSKNRDEGEIINEIMNENKASPSVFLMEKKGELKQSVATIKDSFQNGELEEYPFVTFLGTSSCTPNKYRNISAIFIEPSDGVYLLFDCGENSLDRLFLLYGIEKTKHIIRNIQMICISHHHLDHHSGLYSLLGYRQALGSCKPCLIVTTKKVVDFTRKYDQFFNTNHCSNNCDWLMLDLMTMPNNYNADPNYSTSILDQYENEMNIKLTAVRVFHTSTSYGFVLTGERKEDKRNWKITYSGDMTPKFPELVNQGKDSDILIHEATMDDGLEEMAVYKRHSTMSQAINEGIKMKAKFTMLTHFSSRYPLVPPFDSSNLNVAQAFDFLRINRHSCHYLKFLNEHLEYLFPQHFKLLMLKMVKSGKIDRKRKLSANLNI